jgi:hypothetical protein
MDYATLVKQYPGYSSWNDQTSALNDFTATGGAGKGGSSTPSSSTSSGNTRTATGIDESQIPSTLDYITKLNTTEDTAFQDLLIAMKARKTPLDVYTGLEEASGLPAMRTGAVSLAKAIADIEATLETVEPDVAARSRESLMTEAQRRGVVTQRKEPLLTSLGKTTTGLGNLKELISLTGTDVGTKANLFLQGQEMQLEPQKMKYTALVDRNARLLTGFTSDKETKLQILMDKLNRQQTLDDQEWQLANTLTQSATEYHRQLEEAAASAGARVTGNETDDQLLGLIGTQAAAKIAKAGAATGASGQTSTVNGVLSNIGDITKSSTNIRNDAWQYVWNLQNKQPNMFTSAQWDQIWSYVSGLPSAGVSTSKGGSITLPDGTVITK